VALDRAFASHQTIFPFGDDVFLPHEAQFQRMNSRQRIALASPCGDEPTKRRR
jgi:hypothetical protein